MAIMALVVIVASSAGFGQDETAEESRIGDPAACAANPRCDRLTGCIAPKPPTSATYIIPDDANGRLYDQALIAFFGCREGAKAEKQLRLLSSRQAGLQSLTSDLRDYVSRKIRNWNGEIFWAPASQSSNPITQAGDEVRSVFGPIPRVDCTENGARTLITEVDGNRVDLKPNSDKPGSPLEFWHYSVDGTTVRWTQTLPKCDKPTLAGGVSFCGMNSRLGLQSRGPVEWIVLCRKTVDQLDAEPEVDPKPYWQSTNTEYKLLGYIGFNRLSGEVAFFDGHPESSFRWDDTMAPPGGSGYSDDQGRTEAEQIYDPEFRIRCEECHDNKEPRIFTPYIKQRRVGYPDPKLREKFSLGNLLPSEPRSPQDPYRVIGSSFTAIASENINNGMVFTDPAGNCTACHNLTNLNTGRIFMSDAVGRLDGSEAAHRTMWALSNGQGKIHPWMTAKGGNDAPAEITDAHWDALVQCVQDSTRVECNGERIYTSCPAPGSDADEKTRIPDPALPTDLFILVGPNPDNDSNEFTRKISILWKYHNTLGNVPERDDVRFNVAVKETDLPSGQGEPAPQDFPTLRQATSVQRPGPEDLIVLENVSFKGSTKWTDAPPVSGPRDYAVEAPARCGKRYLVRIVPSRFCFDQSGQLFGTKDHLFHADVTCSP